ncbi:MAG: ATP-dependent DNA helicase [Planctomycetota bacterium]
MTPAQVLGVGGLIARRLPAYEERPQQLAMAEAVAHALANRHHLMVEAGTGVGKSFAYLVPAILAVGEGQRVKRVIIATHTISLQEQLLEKDIPLLRSVLPHEFIAVLAKGRANYVSLRRLGVARARSVGSLFDVAEADQLERLSQWAATTADGSLSDLSFKLLPQVWDEVRSEADNCMGTRCPDHEACHFFAARRRVHNAQILIVNHSLFFSDLNLRRAGVSLLPDYDAVVFDEAHNLEPIASEHLGLTVTSAQVEHLLNRLHNPDTDRGLFVHLDLDQVIEQANRTRRAATTCLRPSPPGIGRRAAAARVCARPCRSRTRCRRSSSSLRTWSVRRRARSRTTSCGRK